MSRFTVTAALALLMTFMLFSQGDPVQAQVTCIGHARSLGLSFFGTPGDDLIDCRGTTANVVIAGLGGKDILIGGLGNDMIMGGDGDDVIIGRDGRDFLKGGGERDLILDRPAKMYWRAAQATPHWPEAPKPTSSSAVQATIPCSVAQGWTFATAKKAMTTSRRPIAKLGPTFPE